MSRSKPATTHSSRANYFRRRHRRATGAFAVGALALTGAVLPVAFVASPAQAATSVVVMGTFQSELGCADDWDTNCTATALTDVDNDGVWIGEFDIPAGNHEFKIRLDNTWDGAFPSDNAKLNLGAATKVAFTVDVDAQKITLTSPDLPGAYDAATDAAITKAPYRDAGAGQSFYFVMTDRFENGDTTNDACIATGRAPEGGALPVDCTGTDRLVTGLDPTDKGFYHGGDIQGLRDKLEYIKGLGVTAIWLTPSFVNRPVQGAGPDASAGYHGYWITDFTQIDPHYGTNADLQAFISDAHAEGIKVYFDIIANHTADVIYYAGHEGTNPPYISKATSPYKDADGNVFDPADYAGTTNPFPAMNPDASSFPYDPEIPAGMEDAKTPAWLNDVTLYHNRGFDPSWPAGEAATYMDFGDLDDLMTENPIVVNGMIDIYEAWQDLGIDGYRIDTAKHVNFEFWQAFTTAMRQYADTEGNSDFFMFGEVYDADAQLLSPYVRNSDMDSVLDFAFQSSALNYVKGFTAQGIAGLFAADDYYTTAGSSAASLPTFLGNHDMGRIGYLLRDSDQKLERSTFGHELMFLTRGQPVVYYGDEQGFTGDGVDKDARENMFASQVPSYLDNTLIDGTPYGTGDHFNTDYPLYTSIAGLGTLRNAHEALKTGAQIELYADNGPGVFAVARVDRTEKKEYLVAFNNTSEAKEVTFATLTPSATYAPLYGTTASLTSSADGEVTLSVPALSAVVLKTDQTVAAVDGDGSITVLAANNAILQGIAPITATIAENRWAETTFSFRKVGDTDYTILGTAEDDTPRVFHDVRGLPAGTAIEYRAVSVDANGDAVAASTFAVVGHDFAADEGDAEPPSGTQVTVPGNHNAAMGCTDNWQPSCAQAALTLDEASGLYTGTWTLPAGSYEYKVAIGGSWSENYGAGGVPDGPNVSYTLASEQAVTFYYDPVSHKFMNTAEGPIVTLPGSFNAAVGCSGDWQPHCMRTWMGPANADGVYTWSTTALPAGSYEVKVAHGLSWDENYGVGGHPGGSNYEFTTQANKLVTFTYTISTHILEIAVEDPPLAGTGQFLGHWVDQTTIAWPANISPNPEVSTFELWADPDGGMGLNEGAVVSTSGADPVKIGTLTHSGNLTAEQLKNRGHLSSFRALTLSEASRAEVEEALRGQVIVVQRDVNGVPEAFTGLQIPGVLDDLYAEDARATDLGPTFDGGIPTVRLWAPTAKNVTLELQADDTNAAASVEMTRSVGGVWSATGTADWKNRAYKFDVQVYVPSADAVVTNSVTDPYSLGLTQNSAASVFVDMADPAWIPSIWTDNAAPVIDKFVDRAIYELHVRDFSIHDETVPANLRGTYKAFALEGTDGVNRLTELANVGMNTVHLLPSFDIATIEENRANQVNPVIPDAAPDSEEQQAAVMAVADEDGFNWGYDPYHYTTPEGSYASDAAQNGGARTAEYREMVGGLHRMGYQVVLDQVFNHTAQSGQNPKSVLDRVVPGYYHRLSLTGSVETSTCCENIATEHQMAEQLMVDSVVTWARDYHVDGFRFDLMGHHSVDNMAAVRAALDELTVANDGIDGTKIYLYGEGWNFGEVANNQRFTQATQGQLNGTHIGAFNDRLRDAVHGGGPFDSNKAIGQGFGTGLYTEPNEANGNTATPEMLGDLRHRQDLIRIGLAGNLRDFSFVTSSGSTQTGAQIDYNGQPAGFASEPDESVNYVDAHDNETLFDVGMWKLRRSISMDDRVRMNTLSLATVTYSQSPSFWHAGTDLLRSKSMDRNSYNSGDHFNRLDWTMQTNNFGVGAPPARDNQEQWPNIKPILASLTPPTPAQIQASRDQAMELLSVRSGQPLLTLGSAELINEKVTFPNAGADQTAGLIVMLIDDTVGTPVDPDVDKLLVVFNASPNPITEAIDGLTEAEFVLAPQLMDGTHDDPVLATTVWAADTGTITVPARSAVVMVQNAEVPPTVIDSVEPVTFQDRDGTENDEYTVPEQDGVEYLIGETVIGAGIHSGSGTVTVTARAKDGYVIADGVQTEWSHTFLETPYVVTTVPEPMFTDLDGTADDTYTIPEATGVDYFVNGATTPTGPGTYPALGTVSIEAKAQTDYVIADGLQTEWSHTFLETPYVVSEVPEPTFTDVNGTENDTYTIPEATGVDYFVNGATTPTGPGTYPALGTVSIEAKAQTDYVIADGLQTEWSRTFSTEPCREFVDVAPGRVFHDEIVWMGCSGISTGWPKDEGTYEFRPLNRVLRDQMAAFLFRTAELMDPTVTDFEAPATSPFVDVPTSHVFYRQIAWMADANISKGWPNGDGTFSFRPYNKVLRDQMAAFIYRLAAKYDIADAADYQTPGTSPFTDVPTNHIFFKEISWMKDAGISTGWKVDEDTYRFGPYNEVLRDQMAAFIYRLMHS